MRDGEPAVLSVRGLDVAYGPEQMAVRGADLDIDAGRGLALVGPSGSGKTSIARSVVRLIPPSAGSVRLHGQELTTLSARAFRRVRHEIQMVFQDPQTSLDPRWRVGRSVAEPLNVGRIRSRHQDDARVAGLFERVGLPGETQRRYPHELSMGQQQRVAIARALAPDPSVLVCDEPVAALDPSVQAQVLELLRELQSERSLAILLVTHDLAVAAQLCTTMSVLDAGRIVESGPTAEILAHPVHERAAALVAAARRLDPASPPGG